MSFLQKRTEFVRLPSRISSLSSTARAKQIHLCHEYFFLLPRHSNLVITLQWLSVLSLFRTAKRGPGIAQYLFSGHGITSFKQYLIKDILSLFPSSLSSFSPLSCFLSSFLQFIYSHTFSRVEIQILKSLPLPVWERVETGMGSRHRAGLGHRRAGLGCGRCYGEGRSEEFFRTVITGISMWWWKIGRCFPEWWQEQCNGRSGFPRGGFNLHKGTEAAPLGEKHSQPGQEKWALCVHVSWRGVQGCASHSTPPPGEQLCL